MMISDTEEIFNITTYNLQNNTILHLPLAMYNYPKFDLYVEYLSSIGFKVIAMDDYNIPLNNISSYDIFIWRGKSKFIFDIFYNIYNQEKSNSYILITSLDSPIDAIKFKWDFDKLPFSKYKNFDLITKIKESLSKYKDIDMLLNISYEEKERISREISSDRLHFFEDKYISNVGIIFDTLGLINPEFYLTSDYPRYIYTSAVKSLTYEHDDKYKMLITLIKNNPHFSNYPKETFVYFDKLIKFGLIDNLEITEKGLLYLELDISINSFVFIMDSINYDIGIYYPLIVIASFINFEKALKNLYIDPNMYNKEKNFKYNIIRGNDDFNTYLNIWNLFLTEFNNNKKVYHHNIKSWCERYGFDFGSFFQIVTTVNYLLKFLNKNNNNIYIVQSEGITNISYRIPNEIENYQEECVIVFPEKVEQIIPLSSDLNNLINVGKTNDNIRAILYKYFQDKIYAIDKTENIVKYTRNNNIYYPSFISINNISLLYPEYIFALYTDNIDDSFNTIFAIFSI